MRIALATCDAFPRGDEDAALLVAGFDRADVQTSWQVWDDPAVDWSSFDATVLRSTWDYTPRRREFLAWATAVPRLVNPYAPVAWSSDKTYLRDLAAAGVPVVTTTFVEPGADVRAALTDLDGEWVVKPSVGAGSVGAGRFALPSARAAAVEHAAALHAGNRTVLLQPYVTAVDTDGETAMLFFDGRFSHAARKAALLTAGTSRGLTDTTDSGAHGLFVEERMAAAQPTPAQLAVAQAAVDLVGSRFDGPLAYVRVDLLPGADGPVVIELELVEPSLFLAYAADPAAAADRAVVAVQAAVQAAVRAGSGSARPGT